ncbi:SOS response-associated peptidase [Kutzneria sp. CA-103260]|uniref:SOS response-associated peptidase n=1 Tax=Kutzneria sp. CA-103260 TaxID=2802641 RepID=UPI001BA50C76|nr:SOS response-associated peptidase [Kutzneria sp. CA-103260]QUQ70978.1 SOS response-associated peptidase [Kutzneria sp. CA-103260]
MCGRYASTKDPATLAVEFDALDATEAEAPGADYNVAPTKPVLAIVARHPRDEEGKPDPDAVVRSIRVMRWGLVPTWSKDRNVGVKMINARSETAATKPAYRDSMARRRCILPADGWFEWKRDGGAKEPFYITNPDDSSLAMAGLWTAWRDPNEPDSPWLVTCAVLTTDAFGPLAEIHERMPLVLPRESFEQWLAPDKGSDDVAELLKPSQEIVSRFELRPVSTAVNSIRNNGPELLVRAEPQPEVTELSLFEQS